MGDSSIKGYWQESARPLSSLLFVVPMLLCYEGGVILLGPQALRNGADLWLRRFLDLLGFGQYFLLPILTCSILLAWHHTRRERWHVQWSVCYGMLLESVLFGLLLLLLAHVQGSVFKSLPFAFTGAASEVEFVQTSQLIGYFGAGIYEELLFRLMLLPLVVGALRAVGFPPPVRIACAVLVTSLIFSAAHYRFDISFAGLQLANAYGDPFDWFSFAFRLFAGVFFSLLFVFRGFGIAVGSHALYDIFVVLL